MRNEDRRSIEKKKKVTGEQKLTSGSIPLQLIFFALPFLGSSLIQQLYNMVDLMFVGKLLGKEASAAVGASSLLVTCMIGFFTGMGVGVGVAASRCFGSGNKKELHKVIHTAAGLTLVGSVFLAVVGWIGAPAFLKWMNTPEDIMVLAVAYIRIYFLSMLSIISYNISSGILRALGNSKSPMIYQLAGGIANVLGNILFIYFLQMGVRGAALATLLSQSVAAVLAVLHLCRLPEEYRLRPRQIRIHQAICRQIFSIGIPAAVQSMIITLSNIIVQSRINTLGVDSIAAFTAYFKVENFIYLPIMAFGQANTTFAGQNIGAGQTERMKKGTRASLIFGIGVAVVMSSLVLLHADSAFGLFTSDLAVMEIGRKLAFTTFPFYFLYVFLEVLSGAIRGTGRAFQPMVIIVVNMCVIRILILNVIMILDPSAVGVAHMYPITWLSTSVCMIFCYHQMTKHL